MSNRPWWASALHVGIMALFVALLTRWLATVRKPARVVEGRQILVHSSATLIVSLAIVGMVATAALFAWSLPATPEEWWIPWAILSFGLVGVPGIAEALRVRHELSRDGIRYQGLLVRHPHVAWQEIDSAHWRDSMKWLSLTTRDGRVLRFSAMLNGLEALARALDEHVPGLQADEATQAMLAAARYGRLPSIWG